MGKYSLNNFSPNSRYPSIPFLNEKTLYIKLGNNIILDIKNISLEKKLKYSYFLSIL